MKKIGITGGIGSGKSFICRMIEEVGFPVFYTDLVAKHLMNEDRDLKNKINELFQKDVYIDGQVDRKLVANIIFDDQNMREALNSIVHPAVYQEFDRWCNHQKSPLVFIESALMIETGYYKNLNAVILVVAEGKIRMERVAKRDNLTFDEVKGRIKAQDEDEVKKKVADYCINNNGDINSTRQQLEEILQKLS